MTTETRIDETARRTVLRHNPAGDIVLAPANQVGARVRALSGLPAVTPLAVPHNQTVSSAITVY
jgi:hypothetical protein